MQFAYAKIVTVIKYQITICIHLHISHRGKSMQVYMATLYISKVINFGIHNSLEKLTSVPS